MKKIIAISILLLTSLTTLHLCGQVTDSAKMDNLIVYGNDFMFSVKEPTGWIGDTENAEKFYANIIFYKNKEDLNNGGAIIQVYSYGKKDEKTEKDLEYDINGYKKDYPNLKLQDFVVDHKEYKCFSKCVYVENEFYQYTVYVNPGSKYKKGISFSMNIHNRPASGEELEAFRQIIASLIKLK